MANSKSVTYDMPSLASGEGVTATVAVAGAELDDHVVVSFSTDLQGITMRAWVSAADTVSVRFENVTDRVIDLEPGTLSAYTNKVER